MPRNFPGVDRDFVRLAHGSEVAEFAMILPILFLLLIGIYWFGQAFRIYGAITNAARDGARAAANPPCTTCGATYNPTASAWAAIQNDLQAADINSSALRPPNTPPAVCACGGAATGCTATTVPCDSSQSNICVQGVTAPAVPGGNPSVGYIQLSQTGTLVGNGQAGGAGECGISVSFQYPYTFWLPGTSLNNQTVNLRAQAQMRAETQ
jgi:Flp pilus assembly protein TadG